MKTILAFGALLQLCSLLFLSCSPKINKFDVSPNRLCGADTPRVSYDVSGTPTLTTRRSGNGDPDSILYTLVVERHGDTAHASQLVLHWTSTPEKSMAFLTQSFGADSLMGSDTIDANAYGKNILIDSVQCRSARAVVVRHGERSVVIPAMSSTAAFRGVDPAGPWDVRGGLTEGEKMGDPTTLKIRLHITLSCGH